MLTNKSVFVLGLGALLTGCVSGTVDLAGDTKSEDLAIITAAKRFYLISSYQCGIVYADGDSMDSSIGVRTVKVNEGLHDLTVQCNFIIPNLVNRVYIGHLSFLAQAGHEYTVLYEALRQCIVVIDEESDTEMDANCDLGGYAVPF